MPTNSNPRAVVFALALKCFSSSQSGKVNLGFMLTKSTPGAVVFAVELTCFSIDDLTIEKMIYPGHLVQRLTVCGVHSSTMACWWCLCDVVSGELGFA